MFHRSFARCKPHDDRITRRKSEKSRVVMRFLVMLINCVNSMRLTWFVPGRLCCKPAIICASHADSRSFHLFFLLCLLQLHVECGEMHRTCCPLLNDFYCYASEEVCRPKRPLSSSTYMITRDNKWVSQTWIEIEKFRLNLAAIQFVYSPKWPLKQTFNWNIGSSHETKPASLKTFDVFFLETLFAVQTGLLVFASDIVKTKNLIEKGSLRF